MFRIDFRLIFRVCICTRLRGPTYHVTLTLIASFNFKMSTQNKSQSLLSDEKGGLADRSNGRPWWYSVVALAAGLGLGVGIGAAIWSDSDSSSSSSSSDNSNLGAVAPFSSCNVGPMHHSHLIVPLAATEDECALETSRFLLSHGATFFCPHTWDIKLLASIDEDAARETLCSSYFNALANDLSPMHAFRPDLDQGGLPASALGQLTAWDSPVIYWIHDFGDDPDGGPDSTWNLTTIYDQTTHVTLEQVLYSRQLELQPAPPNLTYLVHAPVDGATIVLSHYISTGGAAGFDHILIANMTRADGLTLDLRPTWALYWTLPGVADANTTRLAPGTAYDGLLNVYDASTNLPTTLDVMVNVELDYYYGANDGFADFYNICPDVGGPVSPTMCLNGASDASA